MKMPQQKSQSAESLPATGLQGTYPCKPPIHTNAARSAHVGKRRAKPRRWVTGHSALLELGPFLASRSNGTCDVMVYECCWEEETKHSVDGCIHARGTFYVVAVSWKNFRVFTSTTRSLEQALSWRAALTIMRQTAMTRLQSEGGTDHVLLDNEIRNCLKGQPDMDLRFRAEVSGKVTRITPNWQLTLSQLTRLQQAATSRGVKKERKMQTCWDQARAEVEADKELIAHLRKAELLGGFQFLVSA